MKKHKLALLLCLSSLAAPVLMTGCVVAPPYGEVSVDAVVPDYYCWDGYEYVGWVGDRYYYLGPGHVWVACDPVRVRRFNAWASVHPQWRARATVNVGYRVDAAGHSHSVHQAPARHDHGHSHDHDHDHDHDH